MTRMVHTPLLVDQLNQVITVLRFDDLGNLSRLQIGQCVRKLPHEPVQRLGVQFAATDGRTVHRIHAGHDVETGLPLDDALAHIQQPLLGALLGLLDRRRETGDLGINVLFGDSRQTVRIGLLVVTLHLAGNHLDFPYYGTLHSLSVCLLLVTLTQHFAHVEDRHMLFGFERGDRTRIVDERLQMGFHPLCDARIADIHRIDERLIEQQLLHQQLFERFVVGIAVRSVTLLAALFHQLARIFVHLRPEDRRSADDGHHAVQHHLPLLGGPCKNRQHQRCAKQNLLAHQFSIFSSSWIFTLPSSTAFR